MWTAVVLAIPLRFVGLVEGVRTTEAPCAYVDVVEARQLMLLEGDDDENAELEAHVMALTRPRGGPGCTTPAASRAAQPGDVLVFEQPGQYREIGGDRAYEASTQPFESLAREKRHPTPDAQLGRLRVAGDTVVDERHGLVWQRKPLGKHKMNAARHACAALKLEGQRGWRVPTLQELLSVVYALPSDEDWFWTSTDDTSDEPWLVRGDSGQITSTHYDDPSAFDAWNTRCVRTLDGAGRSGEVWPRYRVTNSALETSSLRWQLPPSAPSSQADAAKRCAAAGARLPTLGEVYGLSFVDRIQEPPLGDKPIWTSTMAAPYDKNDVAHPWSVEPGRPGMAQATDERQASICVTSRPPPERAPQARLRWPSGWPFVADRPGGWRAFFDGGGLFIEAELGHVRVFDAAGAVRIDLSTAGPYRIFGRDGKPIMSGQLAAGARSGKFTGAAREEGSYIAEFVAGQRHGRERWLERDGKETFSTEWRNGLRHGDEVHSDGDYQRRTRFRDGLRQGQTEEKLRDGCIHRWSYRDDRQDGLDEVLCKGLRVALHTWHDGQRDGHWELRAPDGKLIDQGEMKAGSGELREWDNGVLVERSTWRAGVRQGAYRRYRGKVVVEEGNYADGKRDGRWVSRDDSGKVESEATWAANQPVHERRYDSDGSLNVERFYTAGKPNGVWRFYKAGKPVAEQRWQNGEPSDVVILK
jgi:antitoxin component YwqK of YwqJK toxin-antitoxin module